MEYSGTTAIELDNNVNGYKRGDMECTINLIKAYDKYINMYVGILKNKIFNIHDRVTRDFIKLYLSKKVRKALSGNIWYTKWVWYALDSAVEHFAQRYNIYDHDEIYDECVIVLLQLAKKYKNTTGKPGFHFFVSRYYHLYLFRNLARSMNETLGRTEYLEYRDGTVNRTVLGPEDDLLLEARLNNYYRIKRTCRLTVKDNTPYNLNWINGITATGPFRDIDMIARKILVSRYINDKIRRETSNEVGYRSRCTLWKLETKALDIIRDYIDYYNLSNKECNDEYEDEDICYCYKWPDKYGIYDTCVAKKISISRYNGRPIDW